MAATAMLAPSRAARSAIASPMPREAPDMKRVLPAKFVMRAICGRGAGAVNQCLPGRVRVTMARGRRALCFGCEMKTCKHIRVEITPGVLAITLARADKKNALTSEMYQALSSALESASADQTIRVVLLDSEGEDFCAGNDIAEFLAMAQSPQALQDSTMH